MENFVIYIAKASLLTAVFFLAYHFLLRKETFFNSNRWFLLAGLVTAVILPAIGYTKIIWIEPTPKYPVGTLNINQFAALQMAMNTKGAPAPDPINWFDVAAGLYFAGVLFFFARFIYDIISLKRLLRGQQIVKLGRYYMVDTLAVQHPFSFFNYIVYNSAVLEPHELESIINHEKVHSSQRHSFDMVIGQLFCIAFWFNPVAWKYKKSISQNLEFIADSVASKQIADARLYQKTMLKFTLQPEYIAITNHFYQSLIKKRIVMLNKQKSRKMNSFKYGLVLPVLAAFMLLFQVKTVAQEKESSSIVKESKVKIATHIHKDSNDEELKKQAQIFKNEFDADVNFQNVKRNDNTEITGIKVTLKDKGKSQVYEVDGTEPIATFTIEAEKDETGKKTYAFGNGNTNRMVKGKNMRINSEMQKRDTLLLERSKRHGSLNNVPTPPSPPAFPNSDLGNGHWSVNSLKFGDTDALIVINGVKQKKGSEIRLPLNQEIAEFNVLKDKEAKKKYGKEGRDGVVEIITRKSGGMRMDRLGNGNTASGYAITIPEGDFNFNFDMDGFGDMGMMEMIDMEEIHKMFEGMDSSFSYENHFSDEDMTVVMERLKKAQEQIKNSMPKVDKQLMQVEKQLKNNNGNKEHVEALEEAKKGIEEARKDLEKARKDLENTRKQLNKKA